MMKNVVFIFEKNCEKMIQIKWAIQEYIDPGLHKIFLIYLLNDKIFFLNDPRFLSGYLNLVNKEEDLRKENALNYLENVENKLYTEFSENLSVKSFLVIGADYGALNIILKEVHPSIVVLGPDSGERGIISFLCGDLESFLTLKIGVPILKISRIAKE